MSTITPLINQIERGPNKWDLMLGLFDNTAASERTLSFYVAFYHAYPDGPRRARGQAYEVLVNSVEREDGSGERWNIIGQCEGQRVSIYYSTQDRNGTFAFI